MAKELPEYERREIVQPQTQPSGFGKAFAELGSVYHGLAEMGSQIAQNAALQRAQQAGLEAGQKPGRNLFPSITASDKAFNEAYRDQSYKVLSAQGQQFLDKLSFDLAKNPNPTAQDLEVFEQNANKGMQDILRLADSSYKSDLKRALEQKYHSDFMSLTGKLETYNQKVIKQQDTLAEQTNLNSMYSYFIRGMDEAGEDAYQREIKNIETSNDTFPEKAARIRELEYQKLFAFKARALQAEIERGDESAIKWLQNFKDKQPDDLDEVQHERMIPELYKQFSKEHQYKALDSQVARAEATDLMMNGKLTLEKLRELQPQMTISDFLQVQKQFGKVQEKELKTIETANFLSENKDNPAALANLKKDELNSGFNQLLVQAQAREQRPFGFMDEAKLAQSLPVAIPSFNNKLSARINSNNPGQAAEASKIYNSMSLANPLAVDGIDAKTAAKANAIDGMIANGSDANEAVAVANKRIEGLSVNEIKEREEFYESNFKKSGYNDPIFFKEVASQACGFDKGIVPPGMSIDFERSLKKYYVLSGDFEESKKLAAQEIKKNYVETEINGYKEVMYLPPGLTYGFTDEFVKKMRYENTLTLFKSISSNFDEGDQLFKYQFLGKEQGTFLHPHHNVIERIDISGKKQKGYLVMKSDDLTRKPQSGTNPSYSLWFMNEQGTRLDKISDPKTGGVARFEITEEQLRNQSKQALIEAEIKANKTRLLNKINREIEELRLSPEGSINE